MTVTGLDGLVRQIAVTEDHVADEDKRAVHEAVAAFLAVDRRALGAASAAVFAYYLDTVRLVREQGWDLEMPEISDPDAVWDYVSFGRDFHVDRDPRDGQVFVSVECECAWQPEQGLQIVVRGGHTVSKVGPFDGHLTNADAFGREGLDSVVYVSPFAR